MMDCFHQVHSRHKVGVNHTACGLLLSTFKGDKEIQSESHIHHPAIVSIAKRALRFLAGVKCEGRSTQGGMWYACHSQTESGPAT